MNCDLRGSEYHSREQQGYFSLHWLLELQDCAAKADTDSEARTKGVTKRTIIRYTVGIYTGDDRISKNLNPSHRK